MKSSGTNWRKGIYEGFFYVLMGIVIVDMLRDGDWMWLIVSIVVGLVVGYGIIRGIGWWADRPCKSKWMDAFQCQRPRNHSGQHRHTTVDGRNLGWSDVHPDNREWRYDDA